MSDIKVEAIENYGLSKKHRKKTLFSKIGIVGCGSEGQNIARIASFNGVEVVFIELSEEKINIARENISKESITRFALCAAFFTRSTYWPLSCPLFVRIFSTLSMLCNIMAMGFLTSCAMADETIPTDAIFSL